MGLEIEIPLPYCCLINWCNTRLESSKLCSSDSVSEVCTLSTVFDVGGGGRFLVLIYSIVYYSLASQDCFGTLCVNSRLC